MEYEDVRDNLSSGKYEVVYKDDPRPEVLRDGFITDRQKSVAWNEEQVDRSKKNLKNWNNRRNAAEQRARDSFEEDLSGAILADLNCNDEQASVIFSAAYERGHSYGYHEVVDHADSYSDLIRRFLEAGDK